MVGKLSSDVGGVIIMVMLKLWWTPNLSGTVASVDGGLRKPPGTTFCAWFSLCNFQGEDEDEEESLSESSQVPIPLLSSQLRNLTNQRVVPNPPF